MAFQIKYTDEVLNRLAKSLKNWAREGLEQGEFRLMSEWCLKNDFPKQNFSRYIAKHKKFNDAYNYAKDYQEYVVSRGGLTKKLDSHMCQFFLSCICKWRKEDDPKNEEAKAKSQLDKICDILQTCEDGCDIEIVD